MKTTISAFSDNLKNTVTALDITWKGMLGIFIVIGIIFVSVIVLNTLTVKEKRTAVSQKLKSIFSRKK